MTLKECVKANKNIVVANLLDEDDKSFLGLEDLNPAAALTYSLRVMAAFGYKYVDNIPNWPSDGGMLLIFKIKTSSEVQK